MLKSRARPWPCLRALQPSTNPLHPLPPNVTLSRFQHTKTREKNHVAFKPKEDAWKFSPEALRQRRQAKATLTTIPDKQPNSETTVGDMWLGKRDPGVSVQEWNARKKELQWLRDPLDVATFVRQELDKGRDKEMALLVRMASHSMQCVVSWNHLIDYYMSNMQISNAMKIYTEMKKRAQFPDSYTYTIILRGLSRYVGSSDVTSKAIAVYHSMFAPNSRVKPTIIHTNAVLRVCSRTLDMDALWSVVGKIPQNGPGAADAITYTTILNTIRQSLIVDVPKGENAEEVAARRERGVVEARRIWEEVIGKWRNADVVIEEPLVCAMARLLLIGSRPRDWDDVLSLVEQTMDIPRLAPPLDSVARRRIARLPHLRAPHTPAGFKADDDHLGPDNPHKRGDEFLAIASHDPRKSSLIYATPGNNILSAILEACQKIVAVEAAEGYWNTITDPTTYAVIADENNLNHLLRLFRQNRASTAAVTSLKEDFLARNLRLSPGTFRLVMSTCVRDKNNHNSLRNATEALKIMLSTLPDADAKTVTMYAKLAVAFPLAKGDDLVQCLAVLQPIVKNIRLQLNVGGEDDSDRRKIVPLSGERRADAIEALRKIYSIYDRLLSSNLIAKDQLRLFEEERKRLSAFMARTVWQQSQRMGEKKTRDSEMSLEGNRTGDDERKKSVGWRASQARPEAQRRPWSSEPRTNDRSF